jgi:glycosyltransferase involved in cell wall biosynthesis
MKKHGNLLLVANWESDVGYAWWLMEGFWAAIADYLEKAGIQCVLVYPKITKIPESISSKNISVKELKFSDKSLSGLKHIRQLIKENNIQYIYLSDWPAFSWQYIALRIFGVKKIIVHEHTPGERQIPSGLKKLAKLFIHRLPFITADHFIAVTQFVYDRFLQVYGIPKRKCFLASNGIYPIDLANTDTHYAQRVFNIPEDKKIVITTGRATYYKGIDFFIECAREIIFSRKYDDFHFLYCGDGPDLNDFKSLVKNYNLSDKFTFAGKRPDIRDILPSCDIGFHAAIGEVGYSLSILEYMSASLITVIPDNPSTALASKHGETGYLYDRNSLSSAVDTIILASENNEQNDRIRKQAKEYVDTCLNISSTHNALERIFDKIILQNS